VRDGNDRLSSSPERVVSKPRPPVWPAWLLALAWGVLPALPALLAGDLLGHPYTDLYPSVWGLWVAAESWPGVVTQTAQLAAPDGMGFYYSSPVKGWLAGILVPFLGVPVTWNLLTVAARVVTVGLFGHAARAWGLRGPGILVVAAAVGCSAVFQGYAVEGIVEGTDGWPLALWAWAAGHKRWGWSAVGLALCVVSSWYLGAVACLLVVFAALRDKKALVGLLGVVLAAPALGAFLSAFSGGRALDPAVRAAMGAVLSPQVPGAFQDGLQPFAISTYTGVLLSLAALGARSRVLLLALIPAVLSVGAGPWYALPVLSSLRFPYRWHLATLAVMALCAGGLADQLRSRWSYLLGVLIAAETLLLARVEPVLPGAPAVVPELYAAVDQTVLDVPGPVSLPPGEINPSRPRSRWFLYAQTLHGQPTPWVPDFNSVGTTSAVHPEHKAVLDAFAAYDRVVQPEPTPLPADTIQRMQALGIGWIVVHHRIYGLTQEIGLRDVLVKQGAELVARDDDRWLLRIPAAVP